MILPIVNFEEDSSFLSFLIFYFSADFEFHWEYFYLVENRENENYKNSESAHSSIYDYEFLAAI